jgi:protein-S-isoprenylcysteine O-methyltransferase Ste14
MLYWIGLAITLLAAVIIFRIFVLRDYLQRGKLGPLAVALEFVIFALHANVIYLYLAVPWPQLPPAPENPVQLYLGGTISVLGLLATLAVMAYLGYSTTVGQQAAGVRQTGPYRLTRNPQLMTYGVLLLGLVIMYPSIQTAAWILLYAAVAQLMVLTEEEHLKNQFGDEYLEYCSRVPRYLGRVKLILPE